MPWSRALLRVCIHLVPTLMLVAPIALLYDAARTMLQDQLCTRELSFNSIHEMQGHDTLSEGRGRDSYKFYIRSWKLCEHVLNL